MDADAATRFIPEHRRTNFKNKGHFKPDELRRRRDMAQVELRKTKRDEALSKRRNLAIIDDAEDSDEDDDLNDATFIRQVCIDFGMEITFAIPLDQKFFCILFDLQILLPLQLISMIFLS